MKTYVNIAGQKLEAVIYGRTCDMDWSSRESKTITANMTYNQAKDLFVDNVPWSITQEFDPVQQKDGSTTTPEPVTYDNTEFCIAGPITDNRDGTISVKMGKPMEVELLQAQLLKAVTTTELDNAYTDGVNAL